MLNVFSFLINDYYVTFTKCPQKAGWFLLVSRNAENSSISGDSSTANIRIGKVMDNSLVFSLTSP